MRVNEHTSSWTVHEALAVAFREFDIRFGADLLWPAFEAMASRRAEVLLEQAAIESELNQFLQYPLNKRGADLDLWISKARCTEDQAVLLLHIGVRWWRARDAMLALPAGTTVPQIGDVEGHVSLSLLKQMLYRADAPHTNQPQSSRVACWGGSRQ